MALPVFLLNSQGQFGKAELNDERAASLFQGKPAHLLTTLTRVVYPGANAYPLAPISCSIPLLSMY
jgi:hypothetical protein